MRLPLTTYRIIKGLITYLSQCEFYGQGDKVVSVQVVHGWVSDVNTITTPTIAVFESTTDQREHESPLFAQEEFTQAEIGQTLDVQLTHDAYLKDVEIELFAGSKEELSNLEASLYQAMSPGSSDSDLILEIGDDTVRFSLGTFSNDDARVLMKKHIKSITYAVEWGHVTTYTAKPAQVVPLTEIEDQDE